MHTLRVAAASIAATAALIAAALGCGTNAVYLTDCSVPTLGEEAADAGPDPCHCDPPPSLSIMACACLSDPTNQPAIDDYKTCIFLFHAQQDAGEGGP